MTLLAWATATWTTWTTWWTTAWWWVAVVASWTWVWAVRICTVVWTLAVIIWCLLFLLFSLLSCLFFSCRFCCCFCCLTFFLNLSFFFFSCYSCFHVNVDIGILCWNPTTNTGFNFNLNPFASLVKLLNSICFILVNVSYYFRISISFCSNMDSILSFCLYITII